MGIFRDKTGLLYGRLTVLSFAGFDRNRHSLWECLCICGKKTVVTSCNLVSGEVRSCGCGEAESRHLSATHGHTRGKKSTPEYRSWLAMRTRCENSNRNTWNRYGGRGIKVCEQWAAFEVFLKDMGPRPKGTSLERIDNDGDYEQNNCRWATQIEQTANTSRNIFLTLDGETHWLSEWARRIGLGEATLRARLRRGWSAMEALTLPITPVFARTRKPVMAQPAHDTEPSKRTG